MTPIFEFFNKYRPKALNKCVFLVSDKESPLTLDVWGAGRGPYKNSKKNFEKKMKLKIQESLHTATHLHDTQHALRQPKAEISKLTRSLPSTFYA